MYSYYCRCCNAGCVESYQTNKRNIFTANELIAVNQLTNEFIRTFGRLPRPNERCFIEDRIC
jgi:hypothetical protein